MEVDLGLHKLDRVGRAEVVFGDQAVDADNPCTTATFYARGVGVLGRESCGLEGEQFVERVKLDHISLGRSEQLVCPACEDDRALFVHRHKDPRPVRSNVAPRHNRPLCRQLKEFVTLVVFHPETIVA